MPLTGLDRQTLTDLPDKDALWRFVLSHLADYRPLEFEDTWRNVVEANNRPITEEQFTLEYTWCVYVSGFKASTVTKKWAALLKAHAIWDVDGKFIPAKLKPVGYTLEPVYAVWKNVAKASAIQTIRLLIASYGWESFLKKYYVRDPEALRALPFMGPALSCHLARNLGNIHVVKPDVHLKRLSNKFGHGDDVLGFCSTLEPTWPLGKIDLALWMACSDHRTK